MRTYYSLFLALCLPLTLITMFAFGDTNTSETNADKSPLLNLKQFPLPPSGIGYHTHDCPEETDWTLCTVYEIQEDKQVKPYSGQLNWEAYNSNGKVVYNSCCTQDNFLKAGKSFMKPGDVYFIVAKMDGEVLLGMPHVDSEPDIAHFTAIPIWTYNDCVQWCPLYYEFCLECNKLQAGAFSEQSLTRGGQRLHDTLNIYVPAKSSVVVTKSSSGIAEVPIYYIGSNKDLSAYYKTIKRTDEKGRVDFYVNREQGDSGLYALHGNCLHPCKKKPDGERMFEVELSDNMVTLVLKQKDNVLRDKMVFITDVEVNSLISSMYLISDESGQIRFIPPLNSQYRILVVDTSSMPFQEYVSLPIQSSAMAETIILDIADKKEESNKGVSRVVSLSDKQNSNKENSRQVSLESRKFWKDVRLTEALGTIQEKSKIHEFYVHRLLLKSQTHIDNKFTLLEMFFLERVLYSQYYTELYDHAHRAPQNVQQPTLAPRLPIQ